MHKLLTIALVCVLTVPAPVALRAGGFLEQIDVTGNVPSPFPGQIVAKLVPIRWDARSIPVNYRVNVNAGSGVGVGIVPNPLGPAFLTVAAAGAALQAAFDEWNGIATSYIHMQIAGEVSKTALPGFDMVNELTFRTPNGFGAIAVSPSVSLIEDATLVHGDDLDGDGDSDVSDAIAVAADVEPDGDIEFPAGFYKAGTIFDNDVQFNTKTSNGFRFTTDPAAIDTVARSVDLMAVALHEFGHSAGLSHTLDNQYGAGDGNGSTMFPEIDAGDPASELALRTLESDDVATISYHYPEGTASSGPAALQDGDIAFASAYGLIQGELRHGVLNQPIAGGAVFARNKETGRFVASAFSGTTQVSFDPVFNRVFLIDPGFNIVDGRYTIPVPKGSYDIGVEPVDGSPVSAANISLAAQIGAIFGQQTFNEEFYNRKREDVVELRAGQTKAVHVKDGAIKSTIDITTNRTFNINNFGSRNGVGFGGQPAGSYYAVRIPASQLTAAATAIGGSIVLQSIAYDTSVVDASVVPVFAEATLTTGSLSSDGSTASLNLLDPLERVTDFIGADDDFAPFFFQAGHDLGRRVMAGIADGSITDLFLVLRIPTEAPFVGVSNIPPLIGLDGSGTASGLPNDVPILGLSYRSSDGITFQRVNNFNFRFSLVLSEP